MFGIYGIMLSHSQFCFGRKILVVLKILFSLESVFIVLDLEARTKLVSNTFHLLIDSRSYLLLLQILTNTRQYIRGKMKSYIPAKSCSFVI